jgi:hypothetical protein
MRRNLVGRSTASREPGTLRVRSKPVVMPAKKKSRNPRQNSCSSPHKEEKGVTIFYSRQRRGQ